MMQPAIVHQASLFESGVNGNPPLHRSVRRDHPDRYADAEAQEAAIGHTYRSAGRDTWPAALADLRRKFESGHVPKDSRSALKETQCRVCSL